MNFNILKKEKWFFILLLFLFFTRFYGLDKFPAGLTHDEVVYAVQAKSFALQGKTLDQSQKFFELKLVHPWYAELPARLIMPFFLIFDNCFIATRFFSVLLGISFPFVFAYFMFGLFNNKKISLFSFFIVAINPLWWQFSRLAYDAVFSTYFYFLGGALFLSKDKIKNIFAMVFLFVGFFNYQGLKLVFMPWIILLILIKHNKEISILFKKNIKKQLPLFFKNNIQSFLMLIISLLFFILYIFFILPKSNIDNRLDSTILGSSSFFAERVNSDRRLSIKSPVNFIFINKFTALLTEIFFRYSQTFDIEKLFVNGENPASAFAVWSHGFFYPVDIILIAFGISYLFRKKNIFVAWLMILTPIIIAIPAIFNISSSWYLLRGFMAYTFLLTFISLGAFSIWELNSKFSLFLFSLIFIFVANFIFHYYIRYPIYAADAAQISERVLAHYVQLLKKENPKKRVVVHTVDPPILFSSFLIYSHRLQYGTFDEIAKNIQDKNFTLDSIQFTTKCIDLFDDQAVHISEYWRGLCELNSYKNINTNSKAYKLLTNEKIRKEKLRLIPAVTDSGGRFHIYYDSLCDGYENPSYVDVNNFSELQIESLDKEEFCKFWIIKN